MTDRGLSQLETLFHPSPTVLLAEEEDETREMLSAALAREGYQVVTVDDGLEMLDYLNLADSGRVRGPDVIVADFRLSGCGGLEACRRAGRRFLCVPFILLAADGDYQAARQPGVDGIVSKPVAEAELREAVASLVN